MLEELPVSPSGKVSRREIHALFEAHGFSTGTGTDADTEVGTGMGSQAGTWDNLVTRVWAAKLNIRASLVTPDADFLELGGDSLTALQVCQQLASLVKTPTDAKAGGFWGDALGPLAPAMLMKVTVKKAYVAHLRHTIGALAVLGLGNGDGGLVSPSLAPSSASLPAAALDVANGGAPGGERSGDDGAHAAPSATAALERVVIEAAAVGAGDLLGALVHEIQRMHLHKGTKGAEGATGAGGTKAMRNTLNLALCSAARTGSPACVGLLLQAGASPMVSGQGSKHPLHFAVQQPNVDVVHLLVQAGANTLALDANRQNIVHWAARTGAGRRVLECVLNVCSTKGKKGKSREGTSSSNPFVATDRWGRTPLHWAVTNGHPTTVQVLLEYSADPAAKDDLDETPLQVAERRAQVCCTSLPCPLSLSVCVCVCVYACV